MAENNGMWKDGAGFSEKCTKVIESFFERYEPVILLSRSRQETWRFQAYDHEELIKSLTEDNPTEDLRNAIMLDTFHRSPGILPYLMELRDRLIRLEGCANKVLECSDSRDKFANECIKSTHNLLETVDDQIDILSIENPEYAICLLDAWGKRWDNPTQDNEEQFDLEKYLEKIRDIFKEDGGCSPAPEKEAEKPAVEAGVQRESFRFDVTIEVKNKFESMFNFLRGYLDDDNDMKAAKTALESCLFGTPDNGYMIKISSRGQAGVASFFGEMAVKAGHDRRATLKSTILKWFVKHDGTSLSNKYVKNNTRANSQACSYVQGLFQKKKENIYGVTEQG